jgi:hypothetical protein
VGDLVVVTPVLPARETALRRHLRGLHDSPLAQLPLATHFARFVVLRLGPRLLFSSRFDGSLERYVAALAGLEEAATIWSHCESDVDLRDPSNLRMYLTRHRARSSYVVPRRSRASVRDVNGALDRRVALSRFAVEAQALDPVGLAHAFREKFVR